MPGFPDHLSSMKRAGDRLILQKEYEDLDQLGYSCRKDVKYFSFRHIYGALASTEEATVKKLTTFIGIALVGILLVIPATGFTTKDPNLEMTNDTTASVGNNPLSEGPEHGVVPPAQTPEGIKAISVPAVVLKGIAHIDFERTVIPGGVVAMDIPGPSRAGPHPMAQWEGLREASNTDPQKNNTKTLTASFATTNYDDNITNTGGWAFIPPDPSGAAGLNHLVNVVNVTVRFHQKDGTLDFNSSLRNFFASQGPVNETFDPKVIYDQYQDRFLIVTLEVVDAAPTETSRILLAVSDDGDPNGTWYMTSWVSKMGNPDTTNPTWADYPGFAVDEVAVYICVTQFGFTPTGRNNEGTKQWVIDKGAAGGFFAGGAATVQFFDLASGLGMANQITVQPAHTFGQSPLPSGNGTFFTMYSGLSGGGIEYIGVMALDDPLGAATASGQYRSIGDIEDFTAYGDAQQSGTATLIETNDRRSLHSVWRDDTLWTSTTIGSSTGAPITGETSAYWVAIDTTAGVGSLTVQQQGTIGGEAIAAGTFTFFPAIGVNSTGDVGIGYSTSAATAFGSAYFETRKTDDPLGTTQAPELLWAGTDFYQRTFGGSRNRWGDYSGLSVDPVNQCFWAYNQYATTRAGSGAPEDGKWSTAFGQFCSCNQSTTLTANQWKLISIPCSTGGSVMEIFGDDGLGAYGTNWAMIERDESSDGYRQLLSTDPLPQGAGYWIKVLSGSPTIDVEGGTSDRRTAYDIPLTHGTDPGLWNMAGHPHTFNVSWGNVEVVDNSSGTPYALSTSTAGNYINNRTMFYWNGSSYQSYHPSASPGSLSTFDGFWVRVKADSTLRIPNTASKLPDVTSLDGWWLQLTAISGAMTDPGNRIGRTSLAKDDKDELDLEELQPYAAPYLTLVFPHEEWSGTEWSYTTDFREARPGAGGEWSFEVRSDIPREVTLTWLTEGDASILPSSRLIDEENGMAIDPAIESAYTFVMTSPTHRLTWHVDSTPLSSGIFADGFESGNTDLWSQIIE